jgi:hypothetical protein
MRDRLTALNFCNCIVGRVDVVRRERCWPQMILLFLIMRCTPTMRELIVATPLSLSSPSATRLLLPRSGLERSDFVRWHEAAEPGCPP